MSRPAETAGEETKPRGVSRRFAVGAVTIAALTGVALGIGLHQASRGSSEHGGPDARSQRSGDLAGGIEAGARFLAT